jgi:hypothetical protein
MAKKIVIGTCPYCLVDNITLETEEHVIPKKWFIHGLYPYKKSIKIDICKPCNNKKSQEDSWMRMWLTSLAFDKSKAAEGIMMGNVKKSVENGKFRPQFQEHYDKMTLVTTSLNGTVLPEEMLQIHVADDWPRVFAYVDQVVRGLFCYKYGAVLPKTHGIKTRYANDQLLRIDQKVAPMLETIGSSNWETDNLPVFCYGMSKSHDSDHWVCFTEFYSTIVFLSVIGSHEWIKEKDEIFNALGREDVQASTSISRKPSR